MAQFEGKHKNFVRVQLYTRKYYKLHGMENEGEFAGIKGEFAGVDVSPDYKCRFSGTPIYMPERRANTLDTVFHHHEQYMPGNLYILKT